MRSWSGLLRIRVQKWAFVLAVMNLQVFISMIVSALLICEYYRQLYCPDFSFVPCLDTLYFILNAVI
jgi:hypothetical protein